MWHQHLYLGALAGTLICLACLLVWVRKRPNVDSSFISISMWCFAALIMLFIEPLIHKLTNHVVLNRYVWYLSFALVDIVAIYLIHRIHKHLGIRLNTDSLIVCVAFVVFALLQIARLADRQLFETELIGGFYREAVPTLNILVWSYIIVVTIKRKAVKRSRKGEAFNE